MNSIIQFLKQTEGAVFVDEEGHEEFFKLKPPLSDQELTAFEAGLPCALPGEMRELLKFASGFEGVLGGVDFADTAGFGLEEVFPAAKALAGDGCGNFWVLDLTVESKSFGPIFFACHDPAVIVYQTDSLLQFIKEAVCSGNEPWKSEIGDVQEELTYRIWRENPCVMDFAQCLASEDSELKGFAKSLDESWEIVDLRKPKLGDGYSWGRYGPTTLNQRCGTKRIFAYQKKTRARRFLDVFR